MVTKGGTSMATVSEITSFINEISPIIQKYSRQYGYKVSSPIIAQACLESGYGKSVLAAQYHNYFGMKCGSKWKGRSVNLKTKEEYNLGILTDIKANFRVYSSMEEGVKGYFEFISTQRYQNLKTAQTPQQYLEMIKADGYATSSLYVTNNMRVIETYALTRFDMIVEKPTVKNYSRDAVVQLAKSWVGLNEADGSYKNIIDIYNTQKTFPRGTKMKYEWAWCACTWSALAIKLGYQDIMPIEISCIQLINIAKKMGIWVENDSYVPMPGDAILYDWQDNGVGDNAGQPDHVGVVTMVACGTITVIEGNYNNRVGVRQIPIGGKFIRGFITPRYTNNTVNNTNRPTTNTSYLYKVSKNCKNRLRIRQKPTELSAIVGYINNNNDVYEIYEECNGWGKLVNSSWICLKYTKKVTVDITKIAKEVIEGKWGNGEERKTRLTNAGYDFVVIQNKVNEIIRKRG